MFHCIEGSVGKKKCEGVEISSAHALARVWAEETWSGLAARAQTERQTETETE